MKALKFLVLSVLMHTGCSGDILESQIKEINSGTYKVSGIQVELRFDFPWPSWGGKEVVLSRDSTEIEFTVEIEYPKGKQDTVRLDGLVGANAGGYQAVNQNCTHPSCYADAKLSDSELSFDLSGAGGLYHGVGWLGAEKLTLETRYEYRGTGIEYVLEGEKIE
jgi:hypothetical protein